MKLFPIVAGGLALVAPSLAQSIAPPPTALFGDRTEVEVVNVEAFVTREGVPVTDLEKSDFRVLEDGVPVEILYFSKIDAAGTAAGGEAPALGTPLDGPALEEPGRFVVYVDSLFLGPARRDRLFSQLAETLGKTLRPRDEVMVISFDGSLKIRTPFTSDRKRIFEALEGAATLDGMQLAAGLEERRDLQTIYDFQRLGERDSCLSLGAAAQQQADRMEHRVVASAEALTAFVNSLGGIPGRKAILHVSDGIPLIAGGTGWQYAIELCDGSGLIRGVPGAVDARVQDSEFDKWDAATYRTAMFDHDTSLHWRRLAAHANAHSVAIYPVQASGLETISLPGDVRMSQETVRFAHHNRQDPLVLMGEETGGRAILETNEFRDAIASMLQDSRSYYLLGFEPRPAEAGSRHEIRVEVERPGLRVRHRKSYLTKSADERVANSVLTTLLHAREENPLGASVTVEPKRVGSGTATDRATVRLSVPFERLTLLPQGTSRHGLLTVFLMTRDLEDGRMTPIRQASIPLRIPVDGPEETFVYEVDMPMDPGRTEVAVALRDDFGGLISYLNEPVDPVRR